MLITLSVPDNTVAILYQTQTVNDHDYAMESEPRKITADMMVKVEQE